MTEDEGERERERRALTSTAQQEGRREAKANSMAVLTLFSEVTGRKKNFLVRRRSSVRDFPIVPSPKEEKARSVYGTLFVG